MRTLPAIVPFLLLLGACGGSDPDAATRDQASEDARRTVETLPLPPGYERLSITDRRAQTPKENRGGGQAGGIELHFNAPAGTTVEQAMQDFDALFTRAGYTRAEYAGKNWCDDDLVNMNWSKPSHVAALHFRWKPGKVNTLDVPYGYDGIVTGKSSSVTAPVDLPTCP